VYNNIIKAADLDKDDIILEVGPGLGFLTVKLAKIVKKVIAVELDDKLVKVLKGRLEKQGIGNVKVVNEDILKITPPLTPPLPKSFDGVKIRGGELKGRGYKIVANLPYNITSVFLRKFLSAEIKPELMVLMLQKEVAERIIAEPGKMSLLAVSVQFFAEAEIVEIVSANNFWPEPKVDSAIIKLTPFPPSLASRKLERSGQPPSRSCCSRDFARDRHGREELSKKELNKLKKVPSPTKYEWERDRVRAEKEFFRLVRIGFSSKRKMLKNNLANGYHISAEQVEQKLKKANFSLKVRAQELAVKDWLKLLGEFN